MSIWSKIKDALSSKKDWNDKVIEKLARESNKHVEERMGKAQDEEDHFTYHNANAQSWNPETHPDGRGDSYVVKSIHYNGKTKELEVEYRWGDKALYKNISKDFVKKFNDADSKGRFAMKHLFDRPFESV